MKKLLLLLLFLAPLAKAQTNEFCPIGSNCAYTGNNTHSGTEAFSGVTTIANINKVLHVNATGPYTTVALALAACPAAPNGCRIIVDDGNALTTVPSFTLGVAPCQNNFAQVLELGVNASLSLSGKISLLCGGYIFGGNRDGSVIVAGGAFPTSTPIIDMGDNVNLIDARVEGVQINCNLVTGCIGIRGRGLNENSYIGRNLIENYLGNGILINGGTVSTGNFKVQENQVLAWTGAGDAISVTDAQVITFERNTESSNSGVQISGAGIHLLGTINTSVHTIIGNHGEKHTDNILIGDKQSAFVVDTDSTNGIVNTVHIAASATGTVVAVNPKSNANSGANPVILNDVTTTNLSSANPPAPFGIIPYYQWENGFLEMWSDSNGAHANNPSLLKSVRGSLFIADQGAVCTNGELALSAGWQSTGAATVTGVKGNGQMCEWTITTGTTTAANPTVTDTLTNVLPNATTVCSMQIVGGNRTAAAGDSFDQTTLSATAPVFTFQGTPTAGGKTYQVIRECGP